MYKRQSLSIPTQEHIGQSDLSGRVESIRSLCSEPQASSAQLGNLSLDGLAAWIKQRLPHVQLSAPELRKLHELSGGAPRLLDEFVRRSSEQYWPRREMAREFDPNYLLSLPRKPEESALERIGRLPLPHRRLLEILAAAQGACSLSTLRAVFDTRRSDEATATTTLNHEFDLWKRRLEDDGFVTVQDGMAGEEIVFASHALAELAYGQIAPDRRQEIHNCLLYTSPSPRD